MNTYDLTDAHLTEGMPSPSASPAKHTPYWLPSTFTEP
jgi:hypothetical protein